MTGHDRSSPVQRSVTQDLLIRQKHTCNCAASSGDGISRSGQGLLGLLDGMCRLLARLGSPENCFAEINAKLTTSLFSHPEFPVEPLASLAYTRLSGAFDIA